MIIKIAKNITIHSIIYFSIIFINKNLINFINYEYISYILLIIIIIIFSESHILNMDLKHIQDKYERISNDYLKFIIETNKKNSVINDIIREHTLIITDVKKQLIEIKNELYFIKPLNSSPNLKSISSSNKSSPNLKSISSSNKSSPNLKSISSSNKSSPNLKSNEISNYYISNINQKKSLDSKSCIF